MKRLLIRDIKEEGFWAFVQTASVTLSVFVIAIGMNPDASPVIPGLVALLSAAFTILLGRAMRELAGPEDDCNSPESPNPENK